MPNMDAFLNYLNRRFKGKCTKDTIKQMKLYLACQTLHENGLIDGVRNQRVYQYYLMVCRWYQYKPVGKIEFVRFVCRWFPYQIVDRTVKVYPGMQLTGGEYQKHRYFVRSSDILDTFNFG
jgi:hypothetical protein